MYSSKTPDKVSDASEKKKKSPLLRLRESAPGRPRRARREHSARRVGRQARRVPTSWSQAGNIWRRSDHWEKSMTWKYEKRTPGVYQHLYLKKKNKYNKKNNHFHSIFKAFAMCAKNINRGNRKEQICVHIGCFEKSNRIVALKASQCRGPIFPTKD